MRTSSHCVAIGGPSKLEYAVFNYRLGFDGSVGDSVASMGPHIWLGMNGRRRHARYDCCRAGRVSRQGGTGGVNAKTNRGTGD